MGQRDAFSSFDIEKVNKMYKCSDVDSSSEEVKPSSNGHNNINELIGEGNKPSDSSKPSPSESATRPSRPNRPFLNLVGSLISQALNPSRN